MTSMPDAVAAPSRSTPSQRGGSAGGDARDGDFSSLVEDAAEDEPDESATRPDRLRRRKEPRPDTPAAAQSTVTHAVVQPAVQPGGSTDAPLMPWMAAANPAAPPPGMPAAPAPNPGEAAALAGQQALSAIGNGNRTTGNAAAPQQPVEPSATGAPTPAGTTQSATSAEGAPQGAPRDATGQNEAEPAFPQSMSVPTEATASTAAMPAPTVAADADADPDGRASRRDESSDPRTAIRSARGTGRPAAADKADQPVSAAASSRTAQPAADAAVAAATPEPAPAFGTPPSANSGTAATGFEALPTLPAQAATHYAAAAASGRAATAHSPAMAQLAAPLVRVLDSGGGEFHIDLAPAELGRIRVVADVSDGKVSLTVQAEQADTLALLRRDLQQLERALGDAGLSLDNSSLQFSLQDDGQSRGFTAPDRDRAAAGWRAQVQSDPGPAPVDDRPMRPIDGLVDVTV
ncbi:flagellar hook-length control protein FliK [Azospirillum humicireducens]|uniref:Flagellar hook-length control protein FliK n=1 Tax=Azospirillum humicireducens TaxID=1226968 RepID=A0A160JI14_9PROT|nr:flagellar hook-length control protein FliK [Azospirillum humicireducens]ANC92690.1 flagellar hook-length control protein FliK [Azospirillum humicireducens]